MEFLHVIPARTGDILEFMRCMEKREDRNEHKFLALVSRNTAIRYVPELLAFPYLEYLETPKGSFSKERKLHSLKKRLQKADVIIWHSLTMSGGDFIPMLYRNPSLCTKSVWVENGQDPESWEAKADSWENALFQRQNRVVRARIPIVGVPLAADTNYIRRLWPEKRVMTLPYPIRNEYVEAADAVREQPQHDFSAYFRDIRENGDTLDFMQWLDVQHDEAQNDEETEQEAEITDQQDRECDLRDGENAEEFTLDEGEAAESPDEENPVDPLRPPHIQIGLSSVRPNQHLQLFTAMKAFRGIPMDIFVPMNHTLEKLAYGVGTKKYRERVAAAGSAQWGEEYHTLSDKADKEAYFKYMSELDVAVLGNRTSICAQYLLLLIRSGIKLFFTENSYVYLWLKQCGLPVHSVEEFAELEYQDFLARDGTGEIPEQLALYYDPKAVMDAWSGLFQEFTTQRGSK